MGVVAVSSMRQDERVGTAGDGKFLWVNGDYQGQPWAGVRVNAEWENHGLTLDAEWLAQGSIRFQMTIDYDQDGNPDSVNVQ